MIFSILLITHWLGDYVFQTSKMALGKSKHLKWLSMHVLAYTGVLSVCALVVFPLKIALSYTLINGVLHGITDYFTSKLAAKYQDNPRIFFPVLGFDQLLHVLTLYVTYLYLESIALF